MNNITDIQYEEVKNKVEQIKKCSKTMGELFNDFTGIITAIYQDDVFQGEASNSLQNKFGNLKTKFDNYVSLVNDFAKVIESARVATEYTEKEIQKEAEELAG